MEIVKTAFSYICIVLILIGFAACGDKENFTDPENLPDLNQQIHSYVTIEDTKVRTGPGIQFRAIAEIRRDSKINVVGRDGEWLLIVSKKGNAPGFIEMAAVTPGIAKEPAPSNPPVKGKYETLTVTEIRKGPGAEFPVVSKIPAGIKINVVGEENGWLRVESKRGNKPGYVDVNAARPLTTE